MREGVVLLGLALIVLLPSYASGLPLPLAGGSPVISAILIDAAKVVGGCSSHWFRRALRLRGDPPTSGTTGSGERCACVVTLPLVVPLVPESAAPAW